MRKVFVFLVFSFFVAGVYAQDKTVESRISAVTVYNDSAFVSRSAQVKLDAGDNTVLFDNILSRAEENSIRAVTDSGHVKIMGAVLKSEYLTAASAENIRMVEADIVAVGDEIRELNDGRTALRDEKKYLDSIQLFASGQLPKDLVTKMPTAQDLENTLTFLSNRLKQNYKDAAALDIKLRDAQKRLTALRQKLNALSGSNNKVKRTISVDLQAAKPVTCEVTVSYMVSGASWQPLYDARADVEKGNVELVSYALIRQATGEKWQDVEMTVSTAKPVTGGRLPYVAPWLLKPAQPRAEEMLLFEEKAKSKRMMVQSQAYNSMALKKDMDVEGVGVDKFAPAAAPVPLSAVADSGVAVTYKLPKKITIDTDNNENKLAISTQQLAADFTYSSFPRASALAYLGSRVKNAANLQLLAGNMNVFLNGEFVGTSTLDNVGPGEEFDLYLGADENVKVKREQTEKKVDETLIGNVLGPNKNTAFKYKIKVENYKAHKIKMRLFEAMPVSQDDRIKVKQLKVNPEPNKKDWQSRKGVYLWQLELEPGKNSEISYEYTIEHPREMVVDGL